jgi:hypothetical protein
MTASAAPIVAYVVVGVFRLLFLLQKKSERYDDFKRLGSDFAFMAFAFSVAAMADPGSGLRQKDTAWLSLFGMLTLYGLTIKLYGRSRSRKKSLTKTKRNLFVACGHAVGAASFLYAWSHFL